MKYLFAGMIVCYIHTLPHNGQATAAIVYIHPALAGYSTPYPAVKMIKLHRNVAVKSKTGTVK